MPMSASVVLPSWVKDGPSIQRFMTQKYFQAPESCDPLRDEVQWLCHVVYEDKSRVESIIDLTARRELPLPKTEANYYFLPGLQRLIGIAFLQSPRGWDLDLISIDLPRLMQTVFPLLSGDYQPISEFQLLPRGPKGKFDVHYCVSGDGCWWDHIQLKRDKIVRKSHVRFGTAAP